MQQAFYKFQDTFKDKSLNEILGCAKVSAMSLELVKDVDEFCNNNFAFVVNWYPTDDCYEEDKISIECSLKDGKPFFTLLNASVEKYGRTWLIIREFNKDAKGFHSGYPLWWEVLELDEGILYMDNCNGEMVFVQNDGLILKTTF